MLRILTRLCVATLTIAGAGDAQSTWIVDSRMRAGFDFVQIQEALDSARVVAGDTLIVRPSSRVYDEIAVTKGVRIVGRPGGGDLTTINGLVIDSIPAGQSVTLSEMYVWQYALIRECRGDVHLEGCNFNRGARSAVVTIRSCDRVTVSNSEFTVRYAPFNVLDSFCSVQRCAFFAGPAPAAPLPIFSEPAIFAERSRVELTATLVVGAPVTCGWHPPTSAIEAVDSAVVVGPLCDVRAGSPIDPHPILGCTVPPVPTFRTTRGTLTLDPRSSAPTTLGHGSATLVRRDVPAIATDVAVAGATVDVFAYGPARASATTFVSALGPPAPLPGFPTVWLDPASTTLADVGTLDASGIRGVILPIPAAVPLGTPLTFQGAQLDPSGTPHVTLHAVTGVR